MGSDRALCMLSTLSLIFLFYWFQVLLQVSLRFFSIRFLIRVLSEPDGDKSIGFETGKVADQSLTASSTLNKYYRPEFGRLNSLIEGGSWCARETNTSEYLQVDLQEIHKISNIILQGKYTGSAQGNGWVTKFSVTYSNDGIVWSRHSEGGVQVGVFSLDANFHSCSFQLYFNL